MIKALIFDFDGTILDTEVPDYQSWQEIYEELGASLPFDTWASFIGTGVAVFDPYQHLAAQLDQPPDREEIALKTYQRRDHLIRQQDALPGVKEYISDAKERGFKLAVASNSYHPWVDGYLDHLGMRSVFEAIKCGDDVKRPKPAPDIYLAALADLGVAASEAIAFEDSPHGIHAARQAGIFSVAVPNRMTARLDFSQANLLLSSLSVLDLSNLLAKVEAG